MLYQKSYLSLKVFKMFTISTFKLFVAVLPVVLFSYWVLSGLIRHRKNISGFIWETQRRLDWVFNRCIEQTLLVSAIIVSSLGALVAFNQLTLFFVYVCYYVLFVAVAFVTYSVTNHELTELRRIQK